MNNSEKNIFSNNLIEIWNQLDEAKKKKENEDRESLLRNISINGMNDLVLTHAFITSDSFGVNLTVQNLDDGFENRITFPKFDNIKIEFDRVTEGPDKLFQISLMIKKEEENILDRFGILVENISYDLEDKEDAMEVLIQINETLREWLRLFKRPRNELTLKEFQGIFGELAFINDLLDVGIDPKLIAEAWRRDKQNDFYFKENVIEVKTSTTINLSINDGRQLEKSDNDNLFLSFYRLNMGKTNDGDSIRELIFEIEEKISQKNSNAFSQIMKKLWDTNYNPAESELKFPRINILERKIFLVGNNFPRLIQKTLPKGVIIDKGYQINSQLCEPYLVQIKEIPIG